MQTFSVKQPHKVVTKPILKFQLYDHCDFGKPMVWPLMMDLNLTEPQTQNEFAPIQR